MFQSRSYSLTGRENLRIRPLEKLTYRNDITDDEHSPSNQFNRRRPGTLPARYKRPTHRSSSVPETLAQPPSPCIDVRFSNCLF